MAPWPQTHGTATYATVYVTRGSYTTVTTQRRIGPRLIILEKWRPPQEHAVPPVPIEDATLPVPITVQPIAPASLRPTWLARIARTPQRDPRALRARLERKDAA